jgi:GntR family transcriptional repressor for pyruvate dehydrogenase complex
MYTPIRSERLFQDIVRQIEERILRGELCPGDRLPTERELAVQFGVSRTAVREAARALAQKGLLEMRPGRGTFVVDQTSRMARETLSLLLRYRPANGLHELLEVRELFEPEIAALAAERVTSEELEALQSLVAHMDRSLSDIESFVAADDDFHRLLVQSSGNSLMVRVFEPIVDLLREQRIRVGYTPDGPRHGQFHHRHILAALFERSAEGARAAMRAHLVQVRRDIAVAAAEGKPVAVVREQGG